ncbi:acyl-CoA N-acyltransferases (NAT) superfamily protein [Wolffia australiana]
MASSSSSALPRFGHRFQSNYQVEKLVHGVFSLSSTFVLPSLVLAASGGCSYQSRSGIGRILCLAPQLCDPETLTVDWSELAIGEARSDDELLASVRLRVRSFYEFNQSFNIEGHKEYVVEREFEALKERVAGKRTGIKRGSCINITAPLSHLSNRADDLCRECKYNDNEEQRVVIATLDLNQCLCLADELPGKKPEGSGPDIPRAYVSNVCVAKELLRNGLAYALVLNSKDVARTWGITDLYVHVAVDNVAAKRLYEKTGFTFESEEPAWQARFLNRARRFLLWQGL